MDKTTIRLIQSQILSLVNAAIPKADKIVFFSSIPFADNPRAVFDVIYDEGIVHNLVYLYRSSTPSTVIERFREKYPDVRVSPIESKEGIKEMLTSKVIIHNDILPLTPRLSQKIVNVWHGHPGKKTGYVHPLDSRDLYLYLDKWTSYFIVSSWLEAGAFSLQFRVHPRKFKVLGQPRLSRAITNAPRARKILEEVLEKDLSNYEKIILYAPTYRYTTQYKYPEKLQEIIYELVGSEDMRSFLKRNDILLVVQPHPSIQLSPRKQHDNRIYNNIVFINHDMFTLKNYIFYDALAAFDILITDHSSIFEDYLILDRPVVFYLPDWDMLRKYTSFMISFEGVSMVGDTAYTINELISALKASLDDPRRHSCERRLLRRLLYEVDETRSAERVAKFVVGLLS